MFIPFFFVSASASGGLREQQFCCCEGDNDYSGYIRQRH
jgi:hypothetical protein